MSRGINVTVDYSHRGEVFFTLRHNDKVMTLSLDEVDILSDLLRLRVEEAIRHLQRLLESR